MVDYSTNVVQSYDGNLQTPIPGPICCFDESFHRNQPLPVQNSVDDFRVSTPIVWTLLFCIGYSFDTPQFQVRREDVAPVNLNWKSPLKTLNDHLGVYSYCAAQCRGPGIANAVLDSDNAGREPYLTIVRLLRLVKADGDSLSVGTYRRLESCINQMFSGQTVGHDGVTSLPDRTASGDVRIGQPAFRRRNALRDPIDPVPEDPPVLRDRARILDRDFQAMCEYGIRVLIDETSILSRLGTGFVLHRTAMANISYNDDWVDPGWPRFNITDKNFRYCRQMDSLGTVFRYDGVDYLDSTTIRDAQHLL